MELTQGELCITSFNTTGFGIGVQNYLTTLSLFSNILCIQEHFLLDGKNKNHSNTNKIRKLLNHKYDMFIIPAFKDDSQVSKGRGKGGLATLWDKGLTKYVSQVKTVSFRIQATKFDLPSGSLLVVNTYFPCDPRVNNFNEEELLSVLLEIKSLMNNHNCNYNLILGDFNSHFSRHSAFTNIVHDFFDENNIKIFWENPDDTKGHLIQKIDFTFQFSNDQETFSSIIDHFAGNQNVYNAAKEAGVLHSGDNPSNHSPIYLKVKLGEIDFATEKPSGEKRVNWGKSSKEAREHFVTTLAGKLDTLDIPDCVSCRDFHCTIHTEQVEEYTMSILETMETAANECLHNTGAGNTTNSVKNVVPGWTQFVKPFSEDSKFWCATWQSAGQPQAGPLHQAMLYSKRQYKYAVRRLKRANENIQNDKFVQSLLLGNSNIFKEIKKFRGNVKSYSSKIDGHVGSHNIAGRFAEKYKELYNQHKTENELNELESNIKDSIGGESLVDVDRVTTHVVKRALAQMKGGKSDALFNIQSDCFTSGPDVLVVHLTNLIRSFIVHGIVPYFVLTCTLLPLVKDNLADITSSENYRAIASGSILLKLLDIVIMILEGNRLQCDQLQFGFQAGSSTTMCTWTASTVIEYYNQRGRPVYACTMDLSKAFDLVEWASLFKILVAKGVQPIFLRVLMFIYRNQTCDVKWNSSYSFRFQVSNGVRQGAVSSPLLFSIYIDDLLVLLRQSGFGCRLDTFYYGVLGYADDLLLLSASRSGLQAMVSICERFARLRRLKFSTNANPAQSKTKCIIFSKVKNCQVNVAPVILNGDPLPWVDKVKHLGNLMEQNNSMKRDCLVKRGKLIGKVNSLLQELHFATPTVKMRLLNTYVTSFYGSCLWDLYSPEVTRIYSTWNVTVRNVFNLPRTAHRYLIEGVSESVHPKTMLCSRFVSFMEAVSKGTKGSVRYLANLVRNDRRTLVGRTLTRIAEDCDTQRAVLSTSSVKNLVYWKPLVENEWRIPMLRELVKVQVGESSLDGFDENEVTAMIDDISTT